MTEELPAPSASCGARIRFAVALGGILTLLVLSLQDHWGEAPHWADLGVVVSLGLLLLLMLRCMLLRPIAEMRGALQRYRRGDFGARLPERGPTDLFELARAINQTLDTNDAEWRAVESEVKADRRYRSIVEDLTELICRFDPELRLTFVSPALCRALGRGEAELIGSSWLALYPEPEHAQIRAQIEALETALTPQAVERRLPTRDGTRRTYLWTERALRGDDGRIAEFQSSGHDVTEARRAQASMEELNEALLMSLQSQSAIAADLAQATELAEEASRAKSAFLANMSHEIRTPMTAILGYAELMLEDEPDPPQRRQHLRTIQRNGEHLLALINDILDLSKIEAGRMTVEQIDCSLADLVRDIERLMSNRVREKGLMFAVEFATAVPRTVQTDPTRLRQILVNLIGNAVKFTEQGSIRMRLDYDDTTGLLGCDIVDTGIGMSDEQLARLFRPFHQADQSTTRRFGGTGLGLAISRELAQILGGDIQVHSTVGSGSTFRVTIYGGNVAGAERIASTGDRGPATAPSRERADAVVLRGRILLAEDGPDNQRLIATILRKAGAEVLLAGDGQQALDQVFLAEREGRPVDAVLMDMQMPVLDGYAATRVLRARGYAGPVIALTANAMTGDREACMAAGCSDFETKPIDRARLLGKLRHHLVTMRQGEGSTSSPRPEA